MLGNTALTAYVVELFVELLAFIAPLVVEGVLVGLVVSVMGGFLHLAMLGVRQLPAGLRVD